MEKGIGGSTSEPLMSTLAPEVNCSPSSNQGCAWLPTGTLPPVGTPRPGRPPPSRLGAPHSPAQRSGGGTQAKACPLPGPLPATRSVYAFAARRVRVGNGPGKPELAVELGRGSRVQKPPPAASQHPGAVAGRKRGVHRAPLPPSAPFPRQRHPFLHRATHGTPGHGLPHLQALLANSFPSRANAAEKANQPWMLRVLSPPTRRQLCKHVVRHM